MFDNGQQTLTWSPDGNLDTVTDTAGTTDYIYDVDDNRLQPDDLALALVEQGFGYTLAPLSPATEGVRMVPVDDFAIHRSVAVQIGDSATPAVARQLEHIAAMLRRDASGRTVANGAGARSR